MKFKFPLQNVLRHRKTKEDLAQKDFMDAQAILMGEQAKLKEMEDKLHESFQVMGQLHQQGGSQGPALMQIAEFKKLQEIRIAGQKDRIRLAEKLVEDKREILRQAALEYKMMDRYRERKFEEYKFERKTNEQKEMDEMSILRFEPGVEE